MRGELRGQEGEVSGSDGFGVAEGGLERSRLSSKEPKVSDNDRDYGTEDNFTHPSGDAHDVVARLRAIMRLLGLGAADFNRTGCTPSQIRRLLDQGSDGLDQNSEILARIAQGLGIDLGYLLSGATPSSLTSKQARRLYLYELLDQFCVRHEVDPFYANKFIPAIMRGFDKKLELPVTALYLNGLPDSIAAVAPLYYEWLKQYRASR